MEKLYEHAHSELSLQQNKRDQIITLYLAIFTFLIPFIISLESINVTFKGLLFIGVGIIGMILAPIIVRYRIYKEIYWLCCQTITQLMNYKNEDIDKSLVQHLFYMCLIKRAKGTLPKNKKGKFSNYLFLKKNFISSETLSYLLIVFLVSIMFAVGMFLMLDPVSLLLRIFIILAFSLLLSIFLIANYFKHLKGVYKVAIDGLDSSFNSTFSKAWFLHFYLDEESEEIYLKNLK